MKTLTVWFILMASLVGVSVAWAEQKKGASSGAKAVEESKKTIDFEGDVVEGTTRQPLDSLNALSEDDAQGSKNHLYRRSRKYNKETRELATEISETY